MKKLTSLNTPKLLRTILERVEEIVTMFLWFSLKNLNY